MDPLQDVPYVIAPSVTRQRFTPDDEYMHYVDLISNRLIDFKKKCGTRKDMVNKLQSSQETAHHYFNTIRNAVNIRKRIPNKDTIEYFKNMFSEEEFSMILKQCKKNPYTKRTPKEETVELLSKKEDNRLRRLKRKLQRDLIYEKEYEMIMKGQINVKKKGHQLRD